MCLHSTNNITSPQTEQTLERWLLFYKLRKSVGRKRYNTSFVLDSDVYKIKVMSIVKSNETALKTDLKDILWQFFYLFSGV